MVRHFLQKVPLFSDLGDQDLDAISEIVTRHKIEADSVIVYEGDAGDSMYIILDGSVKVTYYAVDGREMVLTILEAGSFFGEMSLLDAQPRSATVMTLKKATELAKIRRADFELLLEKNPNMTRTLLSEIMARLRRTSSLLERISTMDVPHRLYEYLQQFCFTYGSERNDGTYEVMLPTHQLIADQLSTSRETVSRSISALKQDGTLTPLGGRGRMQVNTKNLESLLDDFL
ncbi:MAG: Crp/Fnr family transcriptional regulator [Mariprofundaceae bacterium]